MQYNKKNNQLGLTLMEMLVAIGIFTTVVLIALTIFVTISDTQKRVISIQKIQEDIRYAVETMAQEIRLGKIDYAYYVANNIDLYPGASTVETLALIDQTGNYVFFRRQGTHLEYQTCLSTSSPCPDAATWFVITPAEIEIEQVQFFITPSADPFVNVSTQVCSSISPNCPGASYLSYRCDTVTDNRCEYFSDSRHFQPKVRIVLATKGENPNIKDRASISVQTTVTSRILQGSVENLNYE